MARILMVDDEKDLAWSVCRSLSAAGYEVMTAQNGTDALGLARRHPPDLVILDIVLPGMDGLSLCRRLKEDGVLAAARVLFLTVKSAVEDRVKGLHIGADDYLAKPFDLRELHARVQALLRRHTASSPVPSRDLTLAPLVMNGRTRAVRVGTKDIHLTPTEFDLLYHLMSRPEEVFSAQELLQVVWGYPSEIVAPGTDLVRWHIKNLRHKIEPDPMHPLYVRNVPGHGYVLAVSPVSNVESGEGLRHQHESKLPRRPGGRR